MKKKNILILFTGVFLMLITGLHTAKIDAQQLIINSLPMNICSVIKSDKLFHIEVEYPQFETAATSFNQTIANLISNKVDGFKKESLDNWKTKLETLSPNQKVPSNPEVPFEFIASWQPTQLNNKYLSFVIKIYYFTGGAHGNEEIYAFNYGMLAKKEININDFLDSSQEALKKISEISAQNIMSQLQSIGWKEDDNLKGMVNQGTAPVFENFKNFNFNNYNLIIYFQKYQVAPGAAGSLTVTISRKTLEQNSIKSGYTIKN